MDGIVSIPNLPTPSGPAPGAPVSGPADGVRSEALASAVRLAGPGYGTGFIQARHVVNAAACFERYLRYGDVDALHSDA